MHHTVIISDIHLCEVEPKSGLWMRYRQRPYTPGPEIAKMLERLREDVAGDELTLVLNGDIFDFDAPHVINGISQFHDQPRDDAHAVPVIRSILADHPEFVDALARVIADGHDLVFTSGNHDPQLTLAGVREVVRDAVVERAASLASDSEHETLSSDSERETLAARVKFRAWFHLTHDGVLVEHGNQYDPYCSFQYPMAPYHRASNRIRPTLGSLAARLLTSRMGFFNPHVDVTYEKSGLGYINHWFRYYALSKHSLVFAWLLGSFRTLGSLLRIGDPGCADRAGQNIDSAADETGVDHDTLRRHAELFAPPVDIVEGRRMARELWVDRVLFSAFTVTFGAAWLWWAPTALWAGALLGPALFTAYELAMPKTRARDRWAGVDTRAQDVAQIHGAKVVVFGHTHHPYGRWEDGKFFGNSGSWSASYYDVACEQPVFPERPLVWIRSTGEHISGGLMAWTGEAFEPRVVDSAHGEKAKERPQRLTVPPALEWS